MRARSTSPSADPGSDDSGPAAAFRLSALAIEATGRWNLTLRWVRKWPNGRICPNGWFRKSLGDSETVRKCPILSDLFAGGPDVVLPGIYFYSPSTGPFDRLGLAAQGLATAYAANEYVIKSPPVRRAQGLDLVRSRGRLGSGGWRFLRPRGGRGACCRRGRGARGRRACR